MGARVARRAAGRRVGSCGTLLLAGFMLGGSPAGQEATVPPALSVVRPVDECAARAVDEGWERSPSIRELTGRLAGTDVVAYVRCAWLRTDARHGVLAWVGRTATQRFVQVVLSHGIPPQQRIEMLGHELQHAVEVGGAPWADGETSLPVLFRRIGRQTSQYGTFETVAAVEAELRVRREIATSVWPGFAGGGRVRADQKPDRRRQP